MNISGSALYNEMQSMVLGAKSPTEAAASTQQVSNTSGSDFAGMLSDALNNVNAIQKTSKAMATAVERGDEGVTLAQAMIAGQKASVAFEATVQVRNKLVESYKEIMNMPV